MKANALGVRYVVRVFQWMLPVWSKDDLPTWGADWSQFGPDLIATFIGAFLGLLAAFIVERWNARRMSKSRQIEVDVRKRQLCDLLLGEINRNESEMERLVTELASLGPTESGPETAVYKALTSEVLSSFLDIEIASCYSKLNHLQRMLNIYNEQLRSGAASTAQARSVTLPRLRELLSDSAEACARLRSALISTVPDASST